jgi:hypothetical protein
MPSSKDILASFPHWGGFATLPQCYIPAKMPLMCGVIFLGEFVPEYKTLLEFSRPEYVKNLSVSRLQDQGRLKVWLQVSKSDSEETIELSGFEGLTEAVSALLQAERAVISKETNSGKEFGTIRIECWVDECYSEYACDTAGQT